MCGSLWTDSEQSLHWEKTIVSLEVHAKKALHLCLPAAVQGIDELTELNPNVFLLQDKTVKSFPIRCCVAHWLGCSLQS